MPQYRVQWLIPVQHAASPQEAAAIAWTDIRMRRTGCPVSIVTPMVDELIPAGPPTLVEVLPGGMWLPGYSYQELAELQVTGENLIKHW